MNRLLTPKDVQDILGVGRDVSYKLFKLRGFPSLRIGKRYFVQEERLNQYISEHVKSKITV